MNMAIDELAKKLTGKNAIAECSMTELKQMAGEYPWFGPAQLLVAKKIQLTDPAAADEYIQNASIFFHNPIWLVHLLHQTGRIQNREEAFAPLITEQTVDLEEPATFEEVVDQTKMETSLPFTENIAAEELPKEEKNISEELIQPTVDMAGKESSLQPPVEKEEENEEPENDTEETGSQLPLNIPGLKIEPIDLTKAELNFEPYHTIDYFASQGIRAKEEEKSPDRFSQQLKSFTEWLKVLKKIPAAEMPEAASPTEESKVVEMAEHSILKREVVTETMAEVWEKQGKHAEALEVYQKLSLLDPSKSSYFAAKIEHLKQL